ncbi:hypothetical protein MXB_2564 [Myxobolus squamalis]|nr:hypothetical protein MXB_2564 [Myxobolus squamalis]
MKFSMLSVSIFFFWSINQINQLRIEKSLLKKEWIEYKFKYNLEFLEEEETQREKIYMENYQFIIDTNKKNLDFTLEMNKFSHLKKQEIKRIFMPREARKFYKGGKQQLFNEFIPAEYDNRQRGIVTPVKDQYGCGSCYAFSAVASIESAFAIKTGVLTELSEQEIVSCSKPYGNYGCQGGFSKFVYKYCMDNGLSASINYQYTANESFCYQNNTNSSFKLAGYEQLRIGDEFNLLTALYKIGPISIAMDAMHNEFLFYQSGILEIPNCRSYYLNHEVLAVGYNLSETPYLLAKNRISFGNDWGENGYFKIALYRNNMCGIASDAVYPIPLIQES